MIGISSMTKEELDQHLQAILGEQAVDVWWESPNRYFNYNPPLSIYIQSAEGKQAVEEYIMTYCYGK